MSVLETAVTHLVQPDELTVFTLFSHDDPAVFLSARNQGYGVVELSTNCLNAALLFKVGWWISEPEIADPRSLIQGSVPTAVSDVSYLRAVVAAPAEYLEVALLNFIRASFGDREWLDVDPHPETNFGEVTVEPKPTLRMYQDTIDGVEQVGTDFEGQGFYLTGTVYAVGLGSWFEVQVRGGGLCRLDIDADTSEVFAPVLVVGQEMTVQFVVTEGAVAVQGVGVAPPGLRVATWTPASMAAELMSRASSMREHSLDYDCGTQAGRWLCINRAGLRTWRVALCDRYSQMLTTHYQVWQDLGWFGGSLPPRGGWATMLEVKSYWACALAMLSLDEVQRWGSSAQDFANLTPYLTPEEYAELVELARQPGKHRWGGGVLGERTSELVSQVSEIEANTPGEFGLHQTYL